MTQRQNISSGTTWEDSVGYSRLVRIGHFVYVAGTVAVNDSGELVGKDDAYAQTQFIFQKIEHYLHQAGAELRHVVRTRMFVTDVSRWQAVTKAHHEFFADIRPVATLVEISQLINPDYLVEIEVEAIIHD